MALIVQKYGGSSLADAQKIRAVARRIAKTRDLKKKVVAVVSAMGDTTDELINLASQVSNSPEPRELDLLLSSGEVVSCTLMAMALRSLGYDAISLTGLQAGIHTDTAHGRARIDRVDTDRVIRELEAERIVVVAGFQGFTEDLDVTTLGRGGSDTSAVALAAALKAERCEVYTDVEGIYTADPRIVSNARRLEEITYEEMLELAAYGAKMHPRSIELASVYNIPIYVAASFGETPGTLIHGDVPMMEHRVKVTGVTYDRNVAKITLRGVPDRPGIAATLFEPLSAAGISVDTIVQNTSLDQFTDLSFTVTRTDLRDAVKRVRSVSEGMGARDVVTDDSLSKVSIVGAGMLDAPGYASRMFRALADADINIDMITTSEIRITCIVAESRVEDAVQILHKAFQLEEP
ncbi:MAG: aspartate kinase [Chloroflexi bacterium]|nr:aspartate kinase [Chloroflexota bacterium]